MCQETPGPMTSPPVPFPLGVNLFYNIKIIQQLSNTPLFKKRDVLGPKTLRIKSFRALTFFRLESFLSLKFYGQIGVFKDPKILQMGEF